MTLKYLLRIFCEICASLREINTLNISRRLAQISQKIRRLY